MPLTDEDVRQILRIIDETPLDELHVETDGFVLHVRKGGRGDASSRTPSSWRVREDASPSPPQPRTGTDDGVATITAPMLGTFYRAEAPGAKPFVEVGSKIEPNTIVCIIEVMKMMNSVPAGVSGTIAEVIAENAELVEYGQPLFRVEPA